MCSHLYDFHLWLFVATGDHVAHRWEIPVLGNNRKMSLNKWGQYANILQRGQRKEKQGMIFWSWNYGDPCHLWVNHLWLRVFLLGWSWEGNEEKVVGASNYFIVVKMFSKERREENSMVPWKNSNRESFHKGRLWPWQHRVIHSYGLSRLRPASLM